MTIKQMEKAQDQARMAFALFEEDHVSARQDDVTAKGASSIWMMLSGLTRLR